MILSNEVKATEPFDNGSSTYMTFWEIESKLIGLGLLSFFNHSKKFSQGYLDGRVYVREPVHGFNTIIHRPICNQMAE